MQVQRDILKRDLTKPNIHTGISEMQLGLVMGAISLGGLCAFLPASKFSDRFGRKKCNILGSIVMIVASILSVFSSGPCMFGTIRFFIGVGAAFTSTAAPVHIAEISHPRHRALLTNFCNTAVYWGSMLASITSLVFLRMGDNSWSWGAPCLIQSEFFPPHFQCSRELLMIFITATFPSIQLIGLCFTPESPRWLIARSRYTASQQPEDRARAILIKYHANGNEKDVSVLEEFEQIKATIRNEMGDGKTATLLTFVKSKGDLHRLAICILIPFFAQWVGNGNVSYYLTPILSSVGIIGAVQQISINIGMAVFSALMGLAGTIGAKNFGRRPMFLISASGMLGALLAITCMSESFADDHDPKVGITAVVFLFIFFGFYVIAFTPLAVGYPVEILTLRLRSLGFAITETTLYGSGFANQITIPIILSALGWAAWLIPLIFMLFVLVTLYFLIVETKDCEKLEDIAALFDRKARTDEEAINENQNDDDESTKRQKTGPVHREGL